MGYMHIENLYKNQQILMMRECFALTKVHGTSAHVSYDRGDQVEKESLHFFAGGEKHSRFVALFDKDALLKAFRELGKQKVVVHGEAYGGSQQGMSATYGKELKFIAFDVKIDDVWASVPWADKIATQLGFEFVPYVRTSTDLSALDALRDAPCDVAMRRGMGNDKRREGIVLRPIIELQTNNGGRICAKHKCDEFKETKTTRLVEVDPDKAIFLTKAQDIAEEWVTEMRLTHVLDKLGPLVISDTPKVLAAMLEDVLREGKDEFLETREAHAAISKLTAKLFHTRLKSALKNKEPDGAG